MMGCPSSSRLHKDRSHFSAAHNELLELAAECGWPGVVALAWGILVLAVRLRRRSVPRAPPGTERQAVALFGAGTIALAVLAAASFPMQLALVAFPYVLVLSWLLEVER